MTLSTLRTIAATGTFVLLQAFSARAPAVPPFIPTATPPAMRAQALQAQGVAFPHVQAPNENPFPRVNNSFQNAILARQLESINRGVQPGGTFFNNSNPFLNNTFLNNPFLSGNPNAVQNGLSMLARQTRSLNYLNAVNGNYLNALSGGSLGTTFPFSNFGQFGRFGRFSGGSLARSSGSLSFSGSFSGQGPNRFGLSPFFGGSGSPFNNNFPYDNSVASPYSSLGSGYNVGGSASTSAAGEVATTPLQGIDYGEAQLLQSAGLYASGAAQAALTMTEVQRRSVDNWKKTQQTLNEVAQMNRQVRYAAEGYPRAQTPDSYRLSHSSKPRRLTPSELETSNGRIEWPLVLQSDIFVPYRDWMEQLFADRAFHGSLNLDQTLEVRRNADSMQRTLRTHIDEFPPMDYVKARGFIDSLVYELQFSPSNERFAEQTARRINGLTSTQR